ncbi:MAG: hypothetical protein LBJ12_09570 [Oscillospiraceae bacterium]|jgi:sporulation-control protein spo0M|nr:hypothetical protein [Oscillospiraceae bacterium]
MRIELINGLVAVIVALIGAAGGYRLGRKKQAAELDILRTKVDADTLEMLLEIAKALKNHGINGFAESVLSRAEDIKKELDAKLREIALTK